MKMKRIFPVTGFHLRRIAFLALFGLPLLIGISRNTFAHSGGAKITFPEQSVMAGNSIVVKGTGFEGVNEVTVTLEGLSGKENVGTFAIDKEDFEISLQTPMNLEAGVWKVTVAGASGKLSASATITITPHDMEKMDKMMEEATVGMQEDADMGEVAHEGMHRGGEEKEPAIHATRVELNITRPGWLTGVVLVLSIISLTGGALLLVKK